ncbi:SEC-C metal-binding domain-containing protein [Planococcus sp. ISL-110]|uniref:SEC-C metal-binding domain-containing protein n=1 Tax=Planococcus sp. ISL-110 TaxID=2819167 RepID=UPI0020354B30|nr:SEC-C metal-binding domain-containing protein [Planococcus sp. ISL-110]
MEFDHPELESWGQNARAEHERMLKVRDEPFDVTLQRYLKSKKEKTQAVSDKVGRNDPCPCGSGKKYKKCHGK